jgi:hypothetical protein
MQSSMTSTPCATFGGICISSPLRTTTSRSSKWNRSAPLIT